MPRPMTSTALIGPLLRLPNWDSSSTVETHYSYELITKHVKPCHAAMHRHIEKSTNVSYVRIRGRVLLCAAILQSNLIYKGKASIYAGYHASDDVQCRGYFVPCAGKEAGNAYHYAGKKQTQLKETAQFRVNASVCSKGKTHASSSRVLNLPRWSRGPGRRASRLRRHSNAFANPSCRSQRCGRGQGRPGWSASCRRRLHGQQPPSAWRCGLPR
jgi:hypothetical protein